MTKKLYFKGYKVPVYVKTGFKTQGEVFLSENRLLADTSKGADLSSVTEASGKTSDLRHSTSCEAKKDEPKGLA